MNAKQALKAASKTIEDLMYYNKRCKFDIKLYNEVVSAMIQGQSPCEWCEDHEECQLQSKDGKGCEDWMLRWPDNGELENEDAQSGGQSAESAVRK